MAETTLEVAAAQVQVMISRVPVAMWWVLLADYCCLFSLAAYVCFTYGPGLLKIAVGMPRLLPSRAGHKHYTLLLPCCVALTVAQVLTAKIFLVLVAPYAASLINGFVQLLLHADYAFLWWARASMLVGFFAAPLTKVLPVLFTAHRVQQMRHVELEREGFLHCVVVLRYKEPFEELSQTLDSILHQTVPKARVMVVIACEARDPKHLEAFQELEREYKFLFPAGFVLNVHELAAGEAVGPGSNMGSAVRYISKLFPEEEDKFRIMVTKVDSDCTLAPNYLQLVEWTLHHQIDGRRHIYHAPTVETRLSPDTSLFVHAHSLHLAYLNCFNPARWTQGNPALAIQSLCLGFIEEQGGWAPLDEISEDYMQFYKGVLAGGATVSKVVWCVNSVGIPSDIPSRFKQMRRWHWGVTVVSWGIAMLTEANIDIFSVWPSFRLIAKFTLGNLTGGWIWLPLLPEMVAILGELETEALHCLVLLVLASYLMATGVSVLQDHVLRHHVLATHPDYVKTVSPCRRAFLLLSSPFLGPLSNTIFFTLVTWYCLVMCFFNKKFHFNTTAKGTELQKAEFAAEMSEGHSDGDESFACNDIYRAPVFDAPKRECGPLLGPTVSNEDN
ncbi:CC2D2A [Symbiodinium natans]|uniref:CC2D2A protein n=1 Tax=Symbiodinium natans TaxID=878477 RepID=A0A812RDP0_9DINO|nr:CC2D2A [Symbiodinium natans]